ncbi:homoserine kinase [Nocardioides sp. HDW12B]|uniref:homoserine kinase n=1 Tax=Nocardioides sp. HDW12B TaxID=2714939 RepID=UPI00140E5503|nr:homoserine kinase [Nocardioides sp. HDW12B]QIK67121.1 homoserine kinase [Nocardioides sp. HDW12B]
MSATLASGPVTVRVPATSANLGPGFDALGLALDLYDEITAEVLPTAGALEIAVEGEGAAPGAVPRDASHLVVRSLVAGLEAVGAPVPGLRLTCRNVVPHSRGLGSSAAAIVGGLALARALTPGVERSDDDLFEQAAGLEGHPDNVAPAVFGGFTVALTRAHGYAAVRLPVHPDVRLHAFVPPSPVSTSVARGLLPATVPHADAAANAGRAALLVAALTTRPEMLLEATEDRLHQDYRAPAMPETLAVVSALRGRCAAAVVSGAGPTVLVLGTSADGSRLAADVDDVVPDSWRRLALGVGRGVATVA